MTSNNISLVSGWNYISIPVSQGKNVSTDASSNLTFSWTANHDYFKNQTQFTQYYDGYGLFGTLKTIEYPGDMIKIKVKNPGNLVINNSNYITDSSYIINISEGWNWIPYCFENSQNIDSLSSGFSDGDFIKNHTQFTQFYNGYGWFGTLKKFEKNKGYKIKVSNSMSLKFNKPLL